MSDIFITTLGILALFATGYVLLQLYFQGKSKLPLTLIAPLSFILGNFFWMSALSLIALFGSLDIITARTFTQTAVATMLLAIVFSVVITSFNKAPLQSLKEEVVRPRRKGLVSDIIFLVILVAVSIPLLKDSAHSYMIAWDAVAIWMLKAKSFVYFPNVASNILYTDTALATYSHKAYPIGVPLIVATLWRAMTRTNDQVIQLYFVTYYLCLISTFYAGARQIISKFNAVTIGLLAYVALVIPNFLIYSHNGYVDVAISLIITTASVLFIDMIKSRSTKLWPLVMLVTAAGALIKNEGVAFFFVANAVILATFYFAIWNVPGQLLWPKRKPKISIITIFAVACIPIIAWQWAKMHYHIPTDPYISNSSVNLFAVGKIKDIVFAYMDEVVNTNRYGLLMTLTFFVLIVESTFLVRLRKFSPYLPAVLFIAQLGIYTLIYFTTSVPLKWQLQTSYERLWMHLYPSFMLCSLYLQTQISKEDVSQLINRSI